MEDKLVGFETAKLAKEVGFVSDWVLGQKSYNDEGELTGDDTNDYDAPTQSLLQRWLREVHNIEVKVWAERYNDGINWLVQSLMWDLTLVEPKELDFIKDGTFVYGDNHEYPTYEEALEKGLIEAFRLIKQNK